jgi:hypothetical protein
MFDGVPNGNSGGRNEALLRALSPVFELTVLIRPRLLLAAPTENLGCILVGLLYHKEKDAFQSRLRFDLPGFTHFRRRTKWKRWSGEQVFVQRQENVVQLFTRFAQSVGAAEIMHLQFAVDESDAAILRQLWASPIAAFVLRKR